jgi:hypothetical protein
MAKRQAASQPSTAYSGLSEDALLEKIIQNEEVDKKNQQLLSKAKAEQAQLQRAISDLKLVVQELQGAGHVSGELKGSVENLHGSMSDHLSGSQLTAYRTFAEADYQNQEEALKILTERIKTLVARRDQREQDAALMQRRIMASQKNIVQGRKTEEAVSIQTLYNNVSKLRLRAGELRALTSTEALKFPVGTPERAEALAALDVRNSMSEVNCVLGNVHSSASGLERGVQQSTTDDQETQDLLSRHESNKILAAKIARNEEEKLLMSSAALFSRVVDDRNHATAESKRSVSKAARAVDGTAAESERRARVVADKRLQDSLNKNRLFAEQLTEERRKLSHAAKQVADHVSLHNALLDEHAALQAMVSQIAKDIRSTNDMLEKMSTQLDATRKQYEAESRNRELWVCADADKLDQTLVATILNKEDELRDLQAQIAELQSTSKRLATRSLVSMALQSDPYRQGSGNACAAAEDLASTQQQPALAFPQSPLVAGSASKSQLKRSMMMDL